MTRNTRYGARLVTTQLLRITLDDLAADVGHTR
jgi:hypothetical protein